MSRALKSILFLLGFAAVGTSAADFGLLSLNASEVQLRRDSTYAQGWADYGMALLVRGERGAEPALEEALELDGRNAAALRGQAIIAALDGDYSKSLEILEDAGDDTWTLVLRASLLEENGQSDNAAGVLEELAGRSLPEQLWRMLRYVRVEEEARTDSLVGLLADLAESLNVAGDGLDPLATVDIAFFAGINSQSVFGSYESRGDRLALSRALWAYRKRGEAISELAESGVRLGCDERIWLARMLLLEGRLHDAMGVMDEFPSDSLSGEALELRGLLLLRGGKYEEAYRLIQDADSCLIDDRCLAVMGLAAEMAREYPLALEAYCPIFQGCPDSIVVVNRLRNTVYSRTGYATEEERFQVGQLKPIQGTLRVSYSEQEGDLDQSSFSLSGQLSYRYGLYGSRLNASARYSSNRWPESDSKYITKRGQLRWMNFTTSNFYQQGRLEWEDTQTSYDRVRFETSIGAGYTFIFEDLHSSCRPYAGFGRVVNNWNDTEKSEGDLALLPEFGASWSGISISRYLPNIDLGIAYTQYLEDWDSHELDIGMSASFSVNSNLFLSVNRSYSFVKIPPEEIDQKTNSTYLSLDYSFRL